MRNSKQIVYIYDGNSASGEIVQDPDGEIPIPEKHTVIERRGQRWSVVQIIEENTAVGPKTWPVFRIFLQKT
jgi:hypothetical protein